jgi:hypothetical protein
MGGIGLMSYPERHLLNRFGELILKCRQAKAHLNFHICHLNLIGHITALYKDIVTKKMKCVKTSVKKCVKPTQWPTYIYHGINKFPVLPITFDLVTGNWVTESVASLGSPEARL